jgi:hypothetical protein
MRYMEAIAMRTQQGKHLSSSLLSKCSKKTKSSQ